MIYFIKRVQIVTLLLSASIVLSQTDAFITVWNTENLGVSGNTEITIPTISSLTYDYDVDWNNDGVYEETGITGSVTHDFGSKGTFTIRIRGSFPAIQFNNLGDRRKLIEIVQWGTIAWENMNSAFEGCENLKITASDEPDLSGVSSMSQMFKEATNFTGDLSGWDVSSITQMVGTFQETNAFKSDISTWDISNCTDINSMFFEAVAFNQDISGWEVAQMSELRKVFLGASSFDQDLGDWDVTSKLDMTDFFSNSGMSRKNYDRTLIGWSELSSVQSNVDLGAIGLQYCNGSNARNILIQSPFDWNITGDEEDCREAEFITTWETTSVSTAIELSASCISGYNYDVDWNNDGVYDDIGLTDDIAFDYGSAGTQTIRIKGAFPCFGMSSDSRPLLRSVAQWGEIDWLFMASMFASTGLETVTAVDAPDMSRVSSLRGMFSDAENFDGPIGHWDVSQVTDMSFMFLRSASFNQPLNDWDLSNVETISSLFNGASSFNQPLDEWDVSNIKNMISAFLSATSFNQSLSEWDISNVETMASMLTNSGLSMANYDETLVGWNTLTTKKNDVNLGATNLEFCKGEAARQSLIDDYNWSFTGDSRSCPFITKWKTDNPGGSPTTIVIPTEGTGYNYDIDWENDGVYDEFGITRLAAHDYMEAGEYEVAIKGDFPRIAFPISGDFNEKIIDVLQWGDIQWVSMKRAFIDCSNLRVSASDSPDLSMCSDLSSMFFNASSFNDPIEHWDISTITDIESMFGGASSFNQPLNAWGPHISDVTSLSSVFRNASSFNQALDNWDVSNVTSLSSMFFNASSFNQALDSWRSKVTKVEVMSYMFSDATSFNQDLDNWQTDMLTDINYIFDGATSFNGSLDNWNITQITELESVFSGASSFNQSLDSWDVSNVEVFEYMFSNATSFNQPLNWTTTAMEEAIAMFRGATSFNQPLNWNTASLEEAYAMFSGATSFNQPLNWNTSNLEGASSMFYKASSFDQSLGDWNISNLSYAGGMLDSTGLSTDNYDQTLIGWSSQTLMPGVYLGADGLTYCGSYDARANVLPSKGWSFIDDQIESPSCNPDCGNLNNELEESEDWYEGQSIWSLNMFPTFCHNVLVPDGKDLLLRVRIDSSQNEGQCSTLQVDQGGIFTVEAGAILQVVPFVEP